MEGGSDDHPLINNFSLLIEIKVPQGCRFYSTAMGKLAGIQERLQSHANLLRRMAGECWNEVTAEKLLQLARECEAQVIEIEAANSNSQRRTRAG